MRKRIIRHGLPTATHRVYGPGELTGPEYTASQVINANYTNSGRGGNIVGHHDQKALKVVDAGPGPGTRYGCAVNVGISCGASTVTDPNGYDRIDVYVSVIVSDATALFPSDSEAPKRAARFVTGHEVGYGVHICHPEGGCYSPTDPADSLMSTYGGMLQAPLPGVPAATYDVSDRQQNTASPAIIQMRFRQ